MRNGKFINVLAVALLCLSGCAAQKQAQNADAAAAHRPYIMPPHEASRRFPVSLRVRERLAARVNGNEPAGAAQTPPPTAAPEAMRKGYAEQATAAPAAMRRETLTAAMPVLKQSATPAEACNASFSTSFKDGNKNRAHNIAQAAAAINGTVLQPGDRFSFNDAVGPTTKARGYKKARIFVRGKDAEGYGGGVCQVSSTLFNAAEAAGLAVLERHPHSKKVSYVEEGRDAATSFGGIDLRLENTQPFAVRIEAAVDKEAETVTIHVCGL